ncbi:hypothetical protein OF83DRAFT_1101373 [Amylostereum chailletii]|nr:hypothetical protein OF83DRAFT_1101373 [Amylostereum chailletii]
MGSSPPYLSTSWTNAAIASTNQPVRTSAFERGHINLGTSPPRNFATPSLLFRFTHFPFSPAALFLIMSPDSISVIIFLLVPAVALFFAILQLTALRSTTWDVRGPTGFRHTIALFFVLWIFVCSAGVGTTRLVALDFKTKNSHRNLQITLVMVGSFCEACFKWGVNCIVLYLTQRPSFVGALKNYLPAFTAAKARLVVILFLHLVIGEVALSIVFPALKMSGRIVQIPAGLQIIFLVLSASFIIPLERASALGGTSHVRRMWFTLFLAQIAGIVPAALFFVHGGDIKIISAAFTIVWASCTMAALQGYASLPLLITFSPPDDFLVKSSPRKTRFSFSRRGSVPMTPTEQFLSLHDPFATPPASFVLSFDPDSSDSSDSSHSSHTHSESRKSGSLLKPHARTLSLPLEMRQAANKQGRKRSRSVRSARSPALSEFPRDLQQAAKDAHVPPVLKVVVDPPAADIDAERDRALSQLVSRLDVDGAIPSLWRSSFHEDMDEKPQDETSVSKNLDV